MSSTPAVKPAGRRVVLRAVLIAVALAGVAVSALLVAASASPSAMLSTVCAPGSLGDCRTALFSRWGRIGPVPTAALGVAYFLFLALWYAAAGLPNHAGRTRHAVAMVVAALGAGASVAFIGIMAFGLPTWCPWCLAAHALNAALVVGTFAARPRGPQARAVGEAVAARPTRSGIAAAVGLWASLMVAVGAGFTASYYHRAYGLLRGAYLEATNDIDYICWRHASNPDLAPTVHDDGWLAGPAGGHDLVVFMDFECPHCREFEGFASKLRQRYPDSLRIVLKYYPMSRDCSSELPAEHDTHPFACEAAVAAEAARRTAPGEKAWLYRHSLLRNMGRYRERPWVALAAEQGIDTAEFERQRHGPAARQRVAEDVAEAIRLKVEGPGTMFLDGRRLPSWRISTTDALPRTDELQTFRLWDRLLESAKGP